MSNCKRTLDSFRIFNALMGGACEECEHADVVHGPYGCILCPIDTTRPVDPADPTAGGTGEYDIDTTP
jgi:hypothetical protein